MLLPVLVPALAVGMAVAMTAVPAPVVPAPAVEMAPTVELPEPVCSAPSRADGITGAPSIGAGPPGIADPAAGAAPRGAGGGGAVPLGGNDAPPALPAAGRPEVALADSLFFPGLEAAGLFEASLNVPAKSLGVEASEVGFGAADAVCVFSCTTADCRGATGARRARMEEFMAKR